MPVIPSPNAVRNILLFIFTGLVFSATGEFLFSVVVRGDLAGYLSTIPLYTIYLLLVYALSRPLFRQGSRLTAVGIYYLATGCAGLMIEWFLIGNAPWHNTHANQVGMFAFWTSVTMMPVIFTDDRPQTWPLRKQIAITFFLYSLVSLVVGYALPTDELRLYVLVWGVVIGYSGFTYFYWKYARLLASGNQTGLVDGNPAQ